MFSIWTEAERRERDRLYWASCSKERRSLALWVPVALALFAVAMIGAALTNEHTHRVQVASWWNPLDWPWDWGWDRNPRDAVHGEWHWGRWTVG